ncbi:MAG: hypothetical protein HRU36_01080 [Rickettsiales bacterium]|nr:hypothetical protein [Rickettsiales bacterium]
MYIDKEKQIWFSKKEIKVIAGALLVFSYEVWKIERSFKDAKVKFPFAVEDLKHVKSLFFKLYYQCEDDSSVFLFNDNLKMLPIIDISLKECRKYFKECDVAEIGQISEKELDKVSQDFDRFLLKLEREGNKILVL